MPPNVSVVIPTFNRSRLLLNAVETVLAQTHKDYEIIIVDDGSTDDTAQRLGPYMDRVRYVYQENRGVSAARNRGIELATGRWISILDSDDGWLPTKLEHQLRALTTLGDRFGACFTDCTYEGNLDLTRSAFEQAGFNPQSEFGTLDDPVTYILARHPMIWIQSLLVHRRLLEELGGFDEALVVSEDTDLLFRLAFKTRFCFVSAPLVRIDRTPSRPRLTELFLEKSDPLLSCVEHRYQKWLDLPELVDLRTRRHIEESLRTLYYDWVIAQLYQRRLGAALRKTARIRLMGHGYVRIAATLMFRAMRKLCSRLVGGAPER
jgi:glycosyltransferase involved in cell wall biosynthesis